MGQFDRWLDNAGLVAWKSMETLQSVEDPGAPVFPPTYMKPENYRGAEKWSPYVIDPVDGHNVCQMDSKASAANRLEPLFLRDPYRALVPQHVVDVAPGASKPFLLVPQRVGDAVVRFSAWAPQVHDAILALEGGDAEPLARLAPTSLLFGFFDARGTLCKSPRIVSASVTATDVHELQARGHYTPPVDYVALGVIEMPPENDRVARDALSEMGLLPSSTHGSTKRGPIAGGVIVHGEIIRRSLINLIALRLLHGTTPAATAKLQNYLLGLALVVATAPLDYDLRQGCLLHSAGPCEQKLALRSGFEALDPLDHQAVLAFAQAAAREFGVAAGEHRPFLAEMCAQEAKKSKKERKADRKKGRGADAARMAAGGDDADAKKE